jgi:ribosomal protein S18 acetylase RimI-like enzyme
MVPDLRPIAHAALSLSESPFLKHYRHGKFRVRDGVAMTGSELPGPGFNFAACLGPTPPLDAVLPAAREFFAHADQGWGVLVEGDAGHPIEAELKDRGWAVAEDEPAFVLPALPSPLGGEGLGVRDGPTAGLVIRRILSEPDRRGFQRIAMTAFGTTAEFAELIMPNLGFVTDPAMYWVIGEAAGEPAAVGGFYVTGPTAVICCLATLPEYRGKGYGAALTRRLFVEAAARGCRHAALRSGPKSVPLYERLGFRYVCQHRTYAAPPVS